MPTHATRTQSPTETPSLPLPILQIPKILIQTVPSPRTLPLCALRLPSVVKSPLLTHPQPSHIIELMSDTYGPQAATATTAERKPPTLADIVREKTDDGARIIDFFLDVMEARIEGAELCHRIDAAKQLVKYGSKDAARFIARYRGVSCGHSTRGRPDPADPAPARKMPRRRVNAPDPFTEDLLTVLSAVDEDLMARLVRAQTADGGTVIEFLDDVMQDRNDGFRPHHRIAAAKELIVHIVRDEAPEPVPADTSVSVSAQAPSSVRAEPVLSDVEGPVPSLPKGALRGPTPSRERGPLSLS